MKKLSERQLSILRDYADVKDLDPTREGWAYPSELGWTMHGIRELVACGYLDMDGDKHGPDIDYRVTPLGIIRGRGEI